MNTLRFLTLADRVIETELPSFVMGIVNLTPDSFWEGSRCLGSGVDAALRRAMDQIEAGADIIDLGGESSRPGAAYVDEEEELRRVIPVIEAIRKESPCPISVDTRKCRVMRAAFEAGADIVNDISALEDDLELGVFAAQWGLPVVLMHKRGLPSHMQKNTAYADVLAEVDAYLTERTALARSCGIAVEKIIIDPGIGFAKDLGGNRELLRGFDRLCGGRFPVLIGLSRKTCIGEITGRPVELRLAGSLAANLLCAQRGAAILRVHDVAETVDMLRILRSMQT